jgi:hypothetical protein
MATRALRWEHYVPARRIIRKLKGGSQPLLIEAFDGYHYVVKFLNNPQGRNVLFNEAMGTELYKACGLGVRPWKVVQVSNELLDQSLNCWIDTGNARVRPSSYFAFGSRCIDQTEGDLHDIVAGKYQKVVNRDDFWMSWLIDSCAGHADNRQALFLESQDGFLYAFFIDHGHLFGGPNGVGRQDSSTNCYFDLRTPIYL